MLKNHNSNSVRCSTVLTVVAAMLMLAGTAGASVYQLGDSGWSAAVDSEWDITFTVDDLTERAVIIGIQKRFTGEPDEYGLMPAMYVDFIKTSEEAVGQIIITDEYIVNDTSEVWTDFHIELTGSSNPLAGFCNQCIPSGDRFETVVLSGSDGYLGLPTRFDFLDGLVTNIDGEDYFRPGYAYGAMVIIVNPEMEVGQRIFLKEYPTIPEPATLGLMLLGGLLLLRRK